MKYFPLHHFQDQFVHANNKNITNGMAKNNNYHRTSKFIMALSDVEKC